MEILQRLFDPDGLKCKEFNYLVNLLMGVPPKADYASLSHRDFVEVRFLHRLWEIQISYMLLSRSFAMILRFGLIAEPLAKKQYLSIQEILDWSRRIGVKELRELYCSYPDRALMTLFLDLKMEGVCIDAEFVSRLSDKPFTAGMILIDDGQSPPTPQPVPASGPERDFLVSLYVKSPKTKRKNAKARTDEGARKAQDNIIKRIDPNQHRRTISDAFLLWREPAALSESGLSTTLPLFPTVGGLIELLPVERDFWEGPITKAWRDGKLAFMRDQLPILQGEREGIPRLVRSHRQSADRKEQRHRQIAVRHFDPDSLLPESPGRRRLTPSFRQWEEDQQPSGSLWSRRKVQWTFNQLHKLHPRVAEAAGYMAEGMKMRDAAQRAKVSEDTIRRYFNKLAESWKKQK